jgi:hypothetical protein
VAVAEAKARRAILAGIPSDSKQIQVWLPAEAPTVQSSYQVPSPWRCCRGVGYLCDFAGDMHRPNTLDTTRSRRSRSRRAARGRIILSRVLRATTLNSSHANCPSQHWRLWAGAGGAGGAGVEAVRRQIDVPGPVPCPSMPSKRDGSAERGRRARSQTFRWRVDVPS